MPRAVFSPRAKQDLQAIWTTIATVNQPAANALLLRILDLVELAAGQPHAGSPRPELSSTARMLVEGKYLIIYEPRPFGIFVVTVVHGARDKRNWPR